MHRKIVDFIVIWVLIFVGGFQRQVLRLSPTSSELLKPDPGAAHYIAR